MRAFPLSSGYMASASSNTLMHPDVDVPVSTARHGTAGRYDERFNEEVGLFDVVLPRATNNGDEHPKGTTIRLRKMCSTATPKERNSSSDAAAEAAEGSSAVRVAHIENSGNSEGETDPEGMAQSKVREIEKNEERGGEVEQEDAYVEVDKKCSNANGSTDNLSAEVMGKVQQRTTFGQEDLCVTRDSIVTNLNNSATSPLPSSSAPGMAFQTEPQEEVISINDSADSSKCGEETHVPSVPSTRWGHSAASVAAEEVRSAGLGVEVQTTEHGAAICRETEKVDTTSQITVAAVGENSDSKGQGIHYIKSRKSAAGGHGALGDGHAEPYVMAAAAAAYTQEVNGCSGIIGGKTVYGAAEARNEISIKPTFREEKSEDAACEPQEEAKELRSAKFGLAMETDVRSGNTCGTRGDAEKLVAVALHARIDSSEDESRTVGSKEVEVSSAQPGTLVVEQKSPSQVNAEEPRSKQGFDLSRKVRLSTEQQTSLASEGRWRTLVSSRRQLFERGAAAALYGHAPQRPILLEQRNSLQRNGEQAEKEMDATAAAAVREDRQTGELSRKGSVVEMLRERYERSSSGSSVGSMRTQRLANNCALSATLTRGEEGKPEPTWKRRQREKLQATRRAAGQASTAVGDARGSMSKGDHSMCSATAGESLEGGDTGRSAGLGGVDGASSAAEAVGTRTAAETGNDGYSQRNSGQRIRKSVITVQSGECSTVTSLKEKFERRLMPSTQGQQEKQTQQSQRRVQQQRQQTLQRSAEGVKSLREQYERRTSPEDNKSCPCDFAATSALSPVMAKRPLKLSLKQESELSESTTSRQHSDKDTSGTAASSPVKCLREQYQRRLQSSATPSPRAVTPISIVSSTSIKSTRELLGAVDIVGRYGKEYRIAKAEGTLKKEQSHSGGEELPTTAAKGRSDSSAAAVTATAASADEHARSGDKCFRDSSSKNVSPDRHFAEKANTRQQFAYQSAKAEKGGRFINEFDASENGSVSTKGYDVSVKQEEGAPLDVLSTKSQSTVAECKAANRRAGDEALCVATTESTQRTSHVERTQLEGEQRPTVSARASSKIGALASALGPAFSNFGKAPPPRLLTRAEPEAGAEEIDPEMFGYSKAQDAIERRKRELRFLAKTADSNVKEEGNANCDEDMTGRARSSEAAPHVSSVDGIKEQEPESNASEDVARTISIRDQKERRRDVDSDEGVSCEGVTQRNLSSSGGSGEADELSRNAAGTEMSSNAKEQVFDHSGSEGERPHYDTEDNSRNRNGGPKFSRCTSEEMNSCSSPANEVEAVSDMSKAKATRDLNSCSSPADEVEAASDKSKATTTRDCCSYQSSRVSERNTNDSRGDGEAPDGVKGRPRYSRGHGIASLYDHSSGSCPTDVSPGDTSGEAGLSLKLGSKTPPRIPHAERGGVARPPAKAVARKREAADGWVLRSTAAYAAIPQENDGDTGRAIETRGQVSTDGSKTVTANDEPQMALPSHEGETASADSIPIIEEQTAGPAVAPGKADEPDLVREEQLETRKCCADVTEGRTYQDLSSFGGWRTLPSGPEADDEEEVEVETGDK